MTTGEGGMITTDRPDVAEAARMLRQHGALKTYLHETLGFNFRMTNLQAAIGLVQLEKLPAFNERRIANAAHYNNRLGSARLATPVTRANTRHVFHQYTIRVPHGATNWQVRSPNGALKAVCTTHCQSIASHCTCNAGSSWTRLPEADRAATEVLSLPVHPGADR